MSTTPHVLANGDFLQDWSNTGLITTNDDWSGVASIVGYLGNDVVSATGVDARTATGSSSGDADVVANQTNTAITNGGVAEFQIADPTVALNGSNSADAPSLVIHLDATGRKDVRLSFNARDLDASTDDSAQQINVQYRLGSSGAWTNVPSGYAADVTTGGAATQVTPFDLLLPAAVDGRNDIQVRILTTNAVGNDEWVGIDDIRVTSSSESSIEVHHVAFAPDSLTVSHDEGNSGPTVYQFTVERSGGTTGDVAFSGTIASAQTDAADYVGGKPVSFSGSIAAGETSAVVTVTVAGDIDNEANESFTLTLQDVSNSVAVTTTIGSAATATGTIVNDDVGITKISAIQGSGAGSAMVGQTVTVEAIVVGDFQNGDADANRNLNGFYLQEETTDSDGNVLTSEAIFVYGGATDVQIGDRVRVTGSISEYFGLTELTASNISVVQAGAVADVDTMAVQIDLSSMGTTLSQDGDYQPDLEAYEGMLVTIPQTLTVTEQYNLDRFNEIKLVAGERPEQFTQENAPDAAAYQAYLAELGARTITYDDGLNVQNAAINNLDGFDPNDNPSAAPNYGTADAVRMGDTVTGLTGVLDYQWAGNSASGATWRIRSVEDGANTFGAGDNPRTDAPEDVGGRLKVASFNVLNYFTTLDNGGTTAIGEAPRGADNAAEFARQTEKLVATILDMDVDVLALTELENDFSAASSGNAIKYLVEQLNAVAGAGTYAWVDPGQQFVGGDAIAVGFIYDTTAVKIADGTTIEILNDADLPGLGLGGLLGQSTVGAVFDGENTSRNAIAVTFEELATGETFTAIANHLKSKSGTGSGADSDQGDGQGNWQNQRELAATALTAWAASDPTGSGDPDVMLLGDFNGYAKEQSTALIEGAGYENLQDREDGAYSYVFDGQTGTLDYAFANASLGAQVSGVTTWHINADEADALDYNTDYGRDTSIFDGDSSIRVSDHDPVIVGLNLGEQEPTPAYTLQILHASDFEAGLNAVDRAGNFAAIVDYLEETYDNSITLSSGDNFIPSPFFSAGSDGSLKEVYETALETYYGLAAGTLNISPGFGTADMAMLNIIGVQASAIGNHEFDAGTKAFADIIKQTAGYPGAQFPYLAANLDFSADANLASVYTGTIQDADAYTGFPPEAGIGKKIAPATVIEENGEKIGVIGATTQIVQSISSTGGVEVIGDNVDDMAALAAILQPTIDGLLAQGINKIILVSHLQQLALEKALAPLLHGVDVIVAGGSHTLLADETDALRAGDTAADTYPIVTANADGKTTLIVNTSGEYSYVGRLVVDFDAEGNVIYTANTAVNGAYASTEEVVASLYDGNTTVDVDDDGDVDADDADPFADGGRGDLVNDIAQAVGGIIDVQDGNTFGKTEVYLEGRRSEETNLGDLSADANLWYAQKVDPTVLVSIKNGGGIRDSIGYVYAVGGEAVESPPLANTSVGKEAGEVSQLDIANSLRFNNALSMVTVTADQLLEVLEHAVAATTATATPGQFAQVGGIAFSFDKDLPAGNRVQSAALIDDNGNPVLALVANGELVVDPEMAIRVVTLSFLLTGGDGYPFASFIAANPAFANVVNLSPDLVPDAGQEANFAAEGTEQDAFAEYMAANYSDTPYDVADTDRAHDERIQNLDYRQDTVLETDALVLVGDDGDNELTGALGDDVLNGLGGDDVLAGLGGDDQLDGGEGDDTLSGGDGDDTLLGGAGDDTLDGGADDDRLAGGDGDDTLTGGEGDDVLVGGEGYDTLQGGDGNDELVAGAGDTAEAGEGDDLIIVSTDDPAPSLIDGGAGNDTVKLIGGGTAELIATLNVESLLVAAGAWSVAGSESYDNVTIQGGATLASSLVVDNNDHVAIEAGGALSVSGNAIVWQGGGNAVIDNAGEISGSTRALTTTAGATGSVTLNNQAGGVVRGALTPERAGHADATITVNNAGVIEANGRVLDFRTFDNNGASAVINNLAGGVIRQHGSDTDVIRPGTDGIVNNWGTITTDPTFVGGGDLIDFQSDTGGKVNNYAGGWMEASRHAVTGDNAVTVINSGTMIGRNGSAVNLDTDGSLAQKAFITNHGVMEGRSAELADSDGDAIDVDGLVQVLNYGRIAGLGAEGYHDGEPNVSEAIAIGGGEIVNSATGEIYGYGRAIQVDNSSNSNALGATTIVNDGLIQGDGHGPEGVSPADAARFDLRGNEAINLVGDYEDFVGNNSTGRIVGGISMGGGRDTLNNSGSIVATGGSAIDMGAGNDQVNLYVGATVTGTILLGVGDDVALSTSAGGFVIDGGDGSDTIAMDYTYGGDDVLFGGAGNDYIYAGAGNDQVDGGADNDTLYGNDGGDLINGAAGDDIIDGGAGTDTATFSGAIAGYAMTLNADGSINIADQVGTDGTDTLGNIEELGFADGTWKLRIGTGGSDTIVGGLGNDLVFGGAGDDTFIGGNGLDRYDGGDGVDTIDYSQILFKLTIDLDSGLAYYPGYLPGADHLAGIENAVGTAFGDTLIGSAGANTLNGGLGDDLLIGGAGNDVLLGGFGDDVLRSGAGDDTIDGGCGQDLLDLSDATGAVTISLVSGIATGAGIGTDHFSGIEGFVLGAGADHLTGGNGADMFDGGAGNDVIAGGAGNDTLRGGDGDDSVDGGSGNDVIEGGVGKDTLKGGSGVDAISGGDGDDTIDGGSENDMLNGGAGNDTIKGGSGADILAGDAGNDILSGGSGADVFMFAAGFGKDTVTDFATTGASADVLQFSSSLFSNFAEVMSHTTQVGNNVVLTLDADNTVTLANLQMASLAADDFRFV
ncbi:ExeM/NucH family extracellular endonuclease [Bradyrhizobium sp. CCBAU 25338]|uniref:ExeM/NucH family extracellular endonuclease n=1 Tax=Bradyrhizobium sp. CCBAU 25338 TaxID=1641877 RepID=UPI0023036FBE|nr:ExeM/NucH family extracellular endonuclease [Bradyrhizobium sp. CCBAU 25338]MDA9530548.1 5'-nucleotidase [Bradyrhizobium sp. CCBAU 25338]